MAVCIHLLFLLASCASAQFTGAPSERTNPSLAPYGDHHDYQSSASISFALAVPGLTSDLSREDVLKLQGVMSTFLWGLERMPPILTLEVYVQEMVKQELNKGKPGPEYNLLVEFGVTVYATLSDEQIEVLDELLRDNKYDDVWFLREVTTAIADLASAEKVHWFPVNEDYYPPSPGPVRTPTVAPAPVPLVTQTPVSMAPTKRPASVVWNREVGVGCPNKVWIRGFGGAYWQIQTEQECLDAARTDSRCADPIVLSMDDHNCYCSLDACDVPVATYKWMATNRQVETRNDVCGEKAKKWRCEQDQECQSCKCNKRGRCA